MSLINNTMSATALRALLDTNVHVLGDMNDDGSNVRIQNGRANYGTEATPFFSSVEILQQSVDSSQSYLTMSARALFEFSPQNHFVLNPRSIGRQEFTPSLVKQLLDGSYFAAEPETQSLGSKFRSILSLRNK